MNRFIAFLLLLALASCARQSIPVKQQPTVTHEIKEVKLNITLDSMGKMAASSGLVNLRAAKDGIFDYMEIADNFSQQTYWFFDSICAHDEAFIKTLAPFDSLWKLGKLRFIRVRAKGNFNCSSTGGLDAALTCSWTKVMRVAFANGQNPDFIAISSYNNGYGTGNGGISVVGVGNETLLTSPWTCPYYRSIEEILAGADPGRKPKLRGHEDGHAWGLDHYFPAGSLMWYATSGGCALGMTFLPFQKDIILNYINSRIQ